MRVLLCTSCKNVPIYIALYLVVNGPERSLRFYVFYNESIYIMATIGYSLFGS